MRIVAEIMGAICLIGIFAYGVNSLVQFIKQLQSKKDTDNATDK